MSLFLLVRREDLKGCIAIYSDTSLFNIMTKSNHFDGEWKRFNIVFQE